MGQIAAGVFKTIAIKKQTALGTKAPAGAAGTAQYQRRVTSTIDLAKAMYQSNEINPSQQLSDNRHGLRSVAGTLSGELSAGGYQKPLESVLRQLVQTMGATASSTVISATAAGSGSGGTIARSTGSFVADGWKVGDGFRMTGWTTTGAANNTTNCVIIALSALSMTVICPNGKVLSTKVAGDSVVLTAVGKKTWTPLTGHTRDYYTIEHYWADLVQSEVFTDCVFTTASIKLPATGMATIDFGVMGLNMTTGAAQYFTSPAAAPIGGLTAAVNGALVVDGVASAVVTSAEVNISGNFSAIGGVVGANVDPDVIPGKVTASGSLSVLFDGVAYRDKFINETECTAILVLTTNNTDTSDMIIIVMSSVKFGGASKDDGEKALTLTMPFMAAQQTKVTDVNLPTTISIQDTLFA